MDQATAKLEARTEHIYYPVWGKNTYELPSSRLHKFGTHSETALRMFNYRENLTHLFAIMTHILIVNY